MNQYVNVVMWAICTVLLTMMITFAFGVILFFALNMPVDVLMADVRFFNCMGFLEGVTFVTVGAYLRKRMGL